VRTDLATCIEVTAGGISSRARPVAADAVRQRQVLPHSPVVVEQNGRDVVAIPKAACETVKRSENKRSVRG
jgi:hypothetical protein